MKNPAGLTLRELEVELLAGHGASDKEIARILDIGHETVKTQMTSIKRKYAKIGMKKGRRYLMTPEEYQQRMTKLTKELRARHAFLEGVAKQTKEKCDGKVFEHNGERATCESSHHQRVDG